MQPLIWLILLVFLPIGAMAEQDSLQPRFPKHSIKFLLTGVLDPSHAMYAVGYERAIDERFTCLIEGGYIGRRVFDISNPNPNRVTYGFLLRPAIRHYFTRLANRRKRSGRRAPLLYIELQPFYKIVSGNYTGWIPMNCQDDNLEYEFYTQFKYLKQDAGINLLGGMRVGKKPLLEFFTGVGVRYKIYQTENLPANGCIPERLDNITGLLKGWYPSLQGGIRIGVGWR